MTKHLFTELVYDFNSDHWNEYDLPKLSQRELEALARLLGCPHSGTKERLVVRLLAQRKLRFKLSRFNDNPKDLATAYQRASLRDMCREAGIWRSGTKIQMAAGLLTWRLRCRSKGQAFLKELQAAGRQQQLNFRF